MQNKDGIPAKGATALCAGASDTAKIGLCSNTLSLRQCLVFTSWEAKTEQHESCYLLSSFLLLQKLYQLKCHSNIGHQAFFSIGL